MRADEPYHPIGGQCQRQCITKRPSMGGTSGPAAASSILRAALASLAASAGPVVGTRRWQPGQMRPTASGSHDSGAAFGGACVTGASS